LLAVAATSWLLAVAAWSPGVTGGLNKEGTLGDGRRFSGLQAPKKSLVKYEI